MDIAKMAENLKKLREEHSLTQESLAEALSVPVLAVYMWEAGRLALEYKALQRIAEFFETSVEKIVGEETIPDPKSAASEKVSFNCKICGGELVYNYNDCTCRCANCGNKWAIAELYPKYSHVIQTINKASEILSTKTTLAAADEAKLLFKQAINECSKYNDIVSTELVKICKDGQATAKQLEIYSRGKYFFTHRSYKSALIELEKVRGFRDADDMIKKCKRQK
jgi:DNA-binding XRE family transcriptional regulator